MKTIVITGATKGIGKAICEKFASEGFSIAACSRNKNDLDQLKNELEALGAHKVLIKSTDVSKKDEVLDFAQLIKSEFKQVDILINNAGVFIPGKIAEEEDGALESMIETNLYSAYHLTRALLPYISNSSKPHIFNMCSTASKMAYENGGSYSISKFAMLGMSKVLRAELKETNIKVTALMPGPTYTASWEGVDIPESRFMKSSEIADITWATYNLPGNAVVEEMILRPQLGDI
ncbi:MAG: SDR family oxidoreductase [Bacteroidia bacterium]